MKRNSTLALVASMLTLAAIAQAQPPERDGMRERIFDRLDVDGDGVLSYEEFEPPGRRASRFEAADGNDDGVITLDEVQRQIDERAEQHHQKALAHFNEMDTDGDGAVTREERKSAIFSAMDGNGDGVVSLDELRPPQPRHGGRSGRGPHAG